MDRDELKLANERGPGDAERLGETLENSLVKGRPVFREVLKGMAEGMGFEPTIGLDTL